MKLQISEMAKLMGVSVRTLHYYDNIGLLKPAEIDEDTGYRFYDESSVEQLTKILGYREMDFSLKEIQKLLTGNEVLKRDKLVTQRNVLRDKQKQIEMLLANIDEQLSAPIEFGGWFDKILEDYNYSGCTYSSNDTKCFCAWGKANYEKNSSFSVNSRYPIGIITQQFTAMCVLLLEEQGLLDIESYLDDYVQGCKYGSCVKIKHLLNMTSGLSEGPYVKKYTEKVDELCQTKGTNISDKERYYLCHRAYSLLAGKKSLEEIWEIVNNEPLKFTPGEQLDYSNINYEILGLVIEHVSGKSLDQLFKEYIFEPLGMQSTFYGGEADITGYFEEYPITYACYHDGNSGILSTPEDMSKWCEALLDRKILSEKEYQKLFASEQFVCNCYISEIFSEVTIDFEKGYYSIHVRNRVPLPTNKERVMYFAIKGCDDGRVKLEAQEMDYDTSIRVKSVKIFDREAKELYAAKAKDTEYLLDVENCGERRMAADFVTDDSYYLELDVTKLLQEQFDHNAVYILEVRAECESCRGAQIGTRYLHNGEETGWGHWIFFNYQQMYDLFMEALGNVMEALQETA